MLNLIKRWLSINIENKAFNHKKKTNKSVKKSKHKHIYEVCLFYDAKSKYYYRGSYCTVCGKVCNWGMDTVDIGEGRLRVLTQDELKKKYKNSKIINVHNISKVKNVPVEE